MSFSYIEIYGKTSKGKKKIRDATDSYSKVNHLKSMMLTFNKKAAKMGTLFATGDTSF